MVDEPRDLTQTCFGAGSVAGAVIGTFLTTILLLIVAAFLYRQWRKHKGKHLVLVTDPEIVEDAYAFDNPCFRDVTSSIGRILERPIPVASVDTPSKDSTQWSTSWTTLALGSTNNYDKRRVLDDSCLGTKTTRVSIVSLKSRDFTGLGFNVCGNMREGIFVKDLLHRGPASESGKIHPGDRIASVKISFRNMVYEDALTILSYASPYDVELEVESGGSGSKPTTLLKKNVGPGTSRICHPVYRSQSITELSHARSVAKRLFIVDPSESISSNYSTMNSTLKSSKSTPSKQTFEKSHNESKNNHHRKFGIKVLPALDGTVHRIENQNEHNTNLERRHSKKVDAEKHLSTTSNAFAVTSDVNEGKICTENLQQNVVSLRAKNDGPQVTSTHTVEKKEKNNEESIDIPSEVPTEVHNAAMAARRNRKNSSELLNAQRSTVLESMEVEGPKSPQKNKRKAPAPPKSDSEIEPVSPSQKDLISAKESVQKDDNVIDSITDYAESLTSYVNKAREVTIEEAAWGRKDGAEIPMIGRRNSESDTDSEVQNTFTTIELNSTDITIHRTPVPKVNDDEDKDEDVYRKAASLGDLSKYECKVSTTLERAQSLDMTDTGLKKRKAPLPPEHINESTEDLTKLDEIDTFERRKLKKSNEWGTLEDVWQEKEDAEGKSKTSATRKKSNGTLERSKSAVEIKIKDETASLKPKPMDEETSVELYNLPLSKQLTQEFINAERTFDPDTDNSLARIVNDGTVVKSPTFEKTELDFKQMSLSSDDCEDTMPAHESYMSNSKSFLNQDTSMFPKFEAHTTWPQDSSEPSEIDFSHSKDWKDNSATTKTDLISQTSKGIITEVPVMDVTADTEHHSCEDKCNQCDACDNKSFSTKWSSSPVHLQLSPRSKMIDLKVSDWIIPDEKSKNTTFLTYKAKFGGTESKEGSLSMDSRQMIKISDDKRSEKDDEDEDEYEFGSGVTVNSKNLSDREDCRNINNVSVSSGDNSEDSGLVGESMDYNPHDLEKRPPLPCTPVPPKTTYITEIKVSALEENRQDVAKESNERVSVTNPKEGKLLHREIKVTSNGKNVCSKKPPVPPRKSDVAKSYKEEHGVKQILYVSKYKSPDSKESDTSEASQEVTQPETGSKKFEQWIYLGDRDHNRWGKGTSQQQSVTSTVLSSGNDKVIQE